MLLLVAFYLLQLHAAALDRAVFYLTHKRGDDFPGDAGLFNLRRVALFEFASKTFVNFRASEYGDEDRRETVHSTLFEEIEGTMGALHLAMSGEFMAPCPIRLNACFDLVENVYSDSERDDREGEAGPGMRLCLSGFVFRLNRSVLVRMFGPYEYARISWQMVRKLTKLLYWSWRRAKTPIN